MTTENTQIETEMMPDDWNIIELGKIFLWSSGKTRPKNSVKVKTDESPFPVYGGNGILGYSSEKLFDETKLILGRVGEYCGCSHLTEEQSWISDNALYAKTILFDISLSYFKYFFEYLDLNRYANKSGQPLITQPMYTFSICCINIK
jgi:type I restriction enzyme S subunit